MGARSAISDKEVCEAYKYMNDMRLRDWLHHDWPYETLAQKFNVPEKVAYSACERAYDHGLIECGVSLRSGWLTDEGEELLRDIAEVSKESS